MIVSPRAARVAGWSLVGYGLAGIILLLGAFAAASGPLSSIERLFDSLDGTLDAAADSARSTSIALGSVDTGLGEAQTGTSDASGLLADAAATSGRLADAMGLTIFGAQPLIGLADDFRSIQEQLSGLSGNLGSVGQALETSSRDLARVRRDVDHLTTEIESIRTSAGSEAGGTGSIGLALGALLAWLALPAVASLVGGAALLRYARRRALSPPDA